MSELHNSKQDDNMLENITSLGKGGQLVPTLQITFLEVTTGLHILKYVNTKIVTLC